ncbi:hypothetical protein [Blastococcus mobilis]|uniref:Tryptophan-associated transmembrane protein (Trp_oprn_chp) n=1 Tax=Blastococcus mobilis TaxID=1938746 RepID=A0A238VGZ5_9ACTN|nr:hypothetical protein [Blastococcus mobilis]SNR33471.1 hypothetical protein SAMN06272737_103138 [Blastococcus mobilis]
MHPAAGPTRRRPPAPAIAAAVLGLLSASVPAIFLLAAIAFSGGRVEGNAWLLIAVPVLLVLGLLVGGVLLLAGRSWSVLAVTAGVLAALLVYGQAVGGWGAGAFGVLTLLFPLITTVLAVLPRVRAWVTARRVAR